MPACSTKVVSGRFPDRGLIMWATGLGGAQANAFEGDVIVCNITIHHAVQNIGCFHVYIYIYVCICTISQATYKLEIFGEDLFTTIQP